MGIIINEFEAIAEAPAPNTAEQPSAEDENTQPQRLDPMALATALREQDEQAARIWAH